MSMVEVRLWVGAHLVNVAPPTVHEMCVSSDEFSAYAKATVDTRTKTEKIVL